LRACRLFVLHRSDQCRALHSFPTRRSSDLGTVKELRVKVGDKVSEGTAILVMEGGADAKAAAAPAPAPAQKPAPAPAAAAPSKRSEEHTSELQSPYDLVCRLLLEKKKTNTN